MHVSSYGPALAAAMSPSLPGVQYRLVSDETRRGHVLLQLEGLQLIPPGVRRSWDD
jgi:hypothetical protein